MKKLNLFIAIGLIVLCIIGWGASVIDNINEKKEYQACIEQADAWVQKGLYQRAIKEYETLLSEDSPVELYEKIFNAYRLRYEEAPDYTKENYVGFLQRAVGAYPAHETMVDTLVEFYKREHEYSGMYNCLVNAVNNGYNKDKAHDRILLARYAYDFRGGEFYNIVSSIDDAYVVENENGLNSYSMSNGYMQKGEYEYVGMPNGEGICVVTGKDSRLVTRDGFVLAIFDKKVTWAGVYSEGLVPVCCGGSYGYYNEFAEKKLGDYQAVSMFQNGKAAVKKDGKWSLINTNGEVVSNQYEEIILDYCGRYLVNGLILVKESSGSYAVYDEKWKQKCVIQCEDIDLMTKDAMIAVKKNGKWGFANAAGQMIIEPAYEEAKSFSNGMAAVCNNGKWGFINSDGEIVIDYKFTDAEYMGDTGACVVRVDDPSADSGEVDADSEEYKETWKFLKLIIGIVEEKK